MSLKATGGAPAAFKNFTKRLVTKVVPRMTACIDKTFKADEALSMVGADARTLRGIISRVYKHVAEHAAMAQ